MIDKIVKFFDSVSIDTIDQFADRLGLTSIFTTLGLTAAEGVIYQPWVLTDYALLISCAGGILFIIEKLIVIYIRYKESKLLAKKEAQKRKSRNLP